MLCNGLNGKITCVRKNISFENWCCTILVQKRHLSRKRRQSISYKLIIHSLKKRIPVLDGLTPVLGKKTKRDKSVSKLFLRYTFK